jgi:hypothetical protein
LKSAIVILIVVGDEDSAFVDAVEEPVDFHEAADVVDVQGHFMSLVDLIEFLEDGIGMEGRDFAEELPNDVDLVFDFGGIQKELGEEGNSAWGNHVRTVRN